MKPESPPRAAVTRAAIVAAALELLAEHGLEGVSFRRIAARLGVSGPTLYWHVDSKRQLMDLMAEELVRRAGRSYTVPEPGQPWWEWLREDARRLFEALIAVRDAPRVLAGNRPSQESFTGIERVLGVLVGAGLTPGDAQQALFALGAYVIGSATEWQAEAERQREQPLPAAGDEDLNALRARALADEPVLLAAIAELLDRPHDAAFEFGLDLLITGLKWRFAPLD
ncbi:TetR/AcrR family transcriptional regulator C-terminal domain-containing protein [Blastococcus sp. SYSU D00820]